MMAIRKRSLPWVLTIAGAILLAPRFAHADADDRDARLDRGEVIVETHPVDGSDLPEITAVGVIDVPPERVWQILDHCGDYARTMPRVKAARELSRQGTTVRCELVIDSPWPLPKLHSITVAEHIVEPGKWTRRWKLESGDYRENTGSWTLVPRGEGRTLVEYRLHSVPNISVPTFVQKAAMTSALPDLFKKLRAETR